MAYSMNWRIQRLYFKCISHCKFISSKCNFIPHNCDFISYSMIYFNLYLRITCFISYSEAETDFYNMCALYTAVDSIEVCLPSLLYLSTFSSIVYSADYFYFGKLLLHYIPKHNIVQFTTLHFLKSYCSLFWTEEIATLICDVQFRHNLILSNEPDELAHK